MARSSLSDLLVQLRGMTDAGTADWTLGTATYWDDDQLATVLDRHAVDILRESLVAIPSYEGGSTLYKEYRSRYGDFEKTTGGTANFVIEDSTGTDQGTTLWSADYARGVITFGANTFGTAYYLTGRTFDLYAAAADVWRVKAANSAKLFSFSTDGHSLNRDQVMQHCLKMADYYASGSKLQTIQINRGDVNA